MLVLERGLDQSLFMEVPGVGRIVVSVVKLRHGRVRLGVLAPQSVKILRSELEADEERAKGGAL